MTHEIVIGLEVHVQLATATKIFCGCATGFGDPPNTRVCPVCLGLPGALPALNDRAVDLGLVTALALQADVPDVSEFARKNYFYPDLPKGYQISQYDRPLARGGFVPYEVGGERRRARLERLHLEEDAGKSIHGAETRVDLNRCGTPLLEIVTAPDFRRPEEVVAFLESLRAIVRTLGVSDGEMSRGSLRCDANVSVRQPGEGTLGAKTELKNLNRIREVGRAIEAEAGRQAARLDAGEPIVSSTLLWDEAAGATRRMRTKEGANDYRYFPEPDLPPLVIDGARRRRARAAVPELPLARRDRLVADHGLTPADAATLTTSPAVADWFEALATATGDSGRAARWTLGEGLRASKAQPQAAEAVAPPVPAHEAAELLRRVAGGTLSWAAAKIAWERMISTGEPAARVIERHGLAQVTGDAALRALVDRVLADHPGPAAQVRAGEMRVVEFLVGRVMAESGGAAHPDRARGLLVERLAPDSADEEGRT